MSRWSHGSVAAWQREPDAGRDDRRAPGVDGLDDLVGIDALQVDRGHAEVAMLDMRVIAQ